MTENGRTGVLLVNLGSPDNPEPDAVRAYLKEFLVDPRVIDVNPVLKWALLNLVIFPFRPKRSSEAYKKIWYPEGSPLLVHSRRLEAKVDEALEDLDVVLAMRYGQPSLSSGIDTLIRRGCDRIILFPLYPHYASSSTGSTQEAVYRELAQRWNSPSVSVVPPFYDHPSFIDAYAQIARPMIEERDSQHVVFSFHGLPTRHVTKCDATGQHCLKKDNCCDEISAVNQFCYKAQCTATAKCLAKALDLNDDQWTIAFQSRLTRDPWILPDTPSILDKLAADGIKRVAVICPAFVADCLETLEEMGLEASEQFLEKGGEDFLLVPCLNDSPRWVETVCELIREVQWPASSHKAQLKSASV